MTIQIKQKAFAFSVEQDTLASTIGEAVAVAVKWHMKEAVQHIHQMEVDSGETRISCDCGIITFQVLVTFIQRLVEVTSCTWVSGVGIFYFRPRFQ